MTSLPRCCYADTIFLWKTSKKKEGMAHETAQILGMGNAFLPWDDILHRIQTQIKETSRRYENDTY